MYLMEQSEYLLYHSNLSTLTPLYSWGFEDGSDDGTKKWQNIHHPITDSVTLANVHDCVV